jgi:hypothetical protein
LLTAADDALDPLDARIRDGAEIEAHATAVEA